MLDSPEFITGVSETGTVLAETPALIPQQSDPGWVQVCLFFCKDMACVCLGRMAH